MTKVTRFFAVLGALFLTSCATANTSAATEKKSAAEPAAHSLFDGKSLKGWKIIGGSGKFRAEEGCIIGGNLTDKVRKNTFLCTEKTFKDFVFSCEVKFDKLGNSGIMFRSIAEGNRVKGTQMEIDNKLSRRWTGYIYGEGKLRTWIHCPNTIKGQSYTPQTAIPSEEPVHSSFKYDTWNKVVIKAQGRRYQTWINDVLVTDYLDEDGKGSYPEGFIGLQLHGGPAQQVRWRKLLIKELK